MEKHCAAGQATDDNMAHALCTLDKRLQIHTLTVCNTHCFPTTTTVTRTCPIVTIYLQYSTLPVLLLMPSQETVICNKSRTCLRQREATIFDIIRLASARGRTVDMIVLFLIYTLLTIRLWPREMAEHQALVSIICDVP